MSPHVTNLVRSVTFIIKGTLVHAGEPVAYSLFGTRKGCQLETATALSQFAKWISNEQHSRDVRGHR